MKALFHKWLLLLIVLAFGSTFGLSWYLHRVEEKSSALELLEVTLIDAADRVRRSENNLRSITEISAAVALAKTRAFALIIKEKPSILQDREELKLIRRKLDVDELHVSDKSGKLIASLIQNNYRGEDNHIGFDLSGSEQSRVFMRAITDPSFELVQEPRYAGSDGRLIQFTGVARLDQPGVVQVGYSPERIKKARRLADVKNICSEMRVGLSGKLDITENKKYPADHKRVFDTAEGLSRSIVCGKYLLTATLPWKEVYGKGSHTVIITLFIGNLIVFALIFILITRLLQKVVIKKISAVTDSLNEFSQGNFDKKIEVQNSAELKALAESINKTVRALKNSAPPVRAESDSEITVMLKNSLKPSRIPENENYKFTAEILTATEVGGNLCDIFQIDKEHVGIFFADVMEKGVSQGLYMMKAKNLLRKALLKNTPEKALHLVNEELCKNGEPHIPLKAFLGILNLRTAVLLTFNAGHVDPLIKSPNGKTSFVTGPFNPLLGDASSSVFVPFSLQLNAGDRLYFYSSDTIELANATGEKFGRERFLNIISSSGSNAQEIVNAILSDVKEFSGKSSPEAEIAIAVLEYTPVTAGN